MQMFRIPSSILLPALIILIVITAVTSIVSAYRYVNLVEDTNLMRLSPKDDATWGIMQLNTEILKTSNALYSVQFEDSPDARKNLTLRLDILYTRFEVVDEVFSRFRKFSENISPETGSTNFLDKDSLGPDYHHLKEGFLDLDRNVQKFLKSSDKTALLLARKSISDMIPVAAGLAAYINQASNENAFVTRENFLKSMSDYQFALLGIIIVIILFSSVSFGLYFNARQAEKFSRKTARDLKIANSAKTLFLSSMSHELRTPLNAIIGFTQLMGINLGQNRYDKIKEYEGYILKSATHLLDLINQVLDMEKIEAGNVEVEPTDFEWGDIIRESIEMTAPAAKNAGISISVEGGTAILLHTDPFRFRQILLNFLTNAVKYNTDGGHVIVRCESIDDQSVKVSIIDSGIGIHADKRHLLFQPFNRLGRESGQIEGTGIGLSITQSLAVLLDATVGYAPNPDSGSIFWISLPIKMLVGKNTDT